MERGVRHHDGRPRFMSEIHVARERGSREREKDDMIPFFSLRNARECLLGALGIYTLCMIGQEFYKVAGTLAAPLWPSSGLALALLLLGGWRLFPSISLGTIAATQSFGDNMIFSLAGSLANTLESLIGWFLMIQIFGFSNSMTRVRDLLVLMLAGAPWGTMLSAIICTLGLVATGAVTPTGIPLSSLLFWTGNVLGIVIFTPLILRLSERIKERTLFVFSFGGVLWILFVTAIIFFGFSMKGDVYAPLAYLSFPFLIWLAFAWQKDVTFPLALVVLLMIAMTSMGHGPMAEKHNPFATYSQMTMFIFIYSISCLLLMTAVEESKSQEQSALEHRIASHRKEAELRGIRANLNPHFLFNSLNAIKSLIPEDPAKARMAVISLSDLLRTSLRLTKKERVTLREELTMIRSYLDLQRIRHEQRLDCSIDEDHSSLDCLIPPMLFHQLVENAIKHGVESSTESTPIRIRSALEGSSLLLSVENTGRLDLGHESGLGLHSIRKELSVLYGDRAAFTLRESPNHSVVAEIRLPAGV